MGAPAHKPATYDDVLRAPRNMVAEIIHGTLRLHPRPRTTHARSASVLGAELHGPFNKGRGGPGGWVILDEPELHLDAEVLVPDLAGWRRARLPLLPDSPAMTLAPDWVCEVLSPSTETEDRGEKVPLYAKHGVAHVWLVDPDSQLLEVFRLDGATFRLVGTFIREAVVRAEPFDAFELRLGDLWER